MAVAADHKRHIVTFAAITALCLVGDSMLYIVLPVHYQDMGVASLWEVGVILAVNRLVRLPLNPCIGWFYSHVSERTGILIAVALAFATTLSYGFLPNLAFWILARCVWGVAWTLLRLGSLFCILNLSDPDNRGYYTGLYNGLYRLGSLTGMLLGGILADVAGVTVTVAVFATATAFAFFPALFRIPGGRKQQREQADNATILAGFAILARDRNTLWLMAGGCLAALVFQGVVASTLSRLIFEHTGGGLLVFGSLVGASILGGFFQALRWGWEPWLAPLTGRLSDQRFGRANMLACAFALGALSFAALASPLPLPLWFPCILFMQLTATMLTTLNDAAAADAAARAGERTLLMAYALCVDVGAALGPLVAYGMNEFWGINAVYACCAVLFVLLLIRWGRPKRTPLPD
ncbi:MAG: MFS transporter [Deltaproteobacteria bacterium]|jgi:MFS family permease|nr:MFS transporter [Deltaproteobacteria bacterium]